MGYLLVITIVRDQPSSPIFLLLLCSPPICFSLLTRVLAEIDLCCAFLIQCLVGRGECLGLFEQLSTYTSAKDPNAIRRDIPLKRSLRRFHSSFSFGGSALTLSSSSLSRLALRAAINSFRQSLNVAGVSGVPLVRAASFCKSQPRTPHQTAHSVSSCSSASRYMDSLLHTPLPSCPLRPSPSSIFRQRPQRGSPWRQMQL